MNVRFQTPIQEIISKAIYLVLLLTLPIILLSQLQPLYHWRFEAYHVYQAFSTVLTKEQINHKFNEIQQFIRPPFNSSLDEGFWSQEDILHMQDVRNLFIVIYLLTFVSFCVMLVDIWRYKEVRGLAELKVWFRNLLVGLAVLAAPIIIWWQPAFTLFHRIVFPHNDYWMLDPNTSNLIKYFDNNIFLELFILYIFILVLEYGLIDILSKWKLHKQEK